MYDRRICTCGKVEEGKTACTTAGIVHAEKEVREKVHVHLQELYMRKSGGGQNRMYTCRNCTCGKGGEGESACTTTETVHAERGMREKPHV